MRLVVPAITILAGSLALSAGTKLSKAVIAGELAPIQACLAAGEKIDEFDKWGWTPLLWAVYYQYPVITNQLLAQGADPNIAATKGYSSIAPGSTPLIVASYYGLEDQVGPLLSKGAKPERLDAKGMSALAYAKQFHFSGIESSVFERNSIFSTWMLSSPVRVRNR